MSYLFNLFRTGALNKTPKRIIGTIVNEISLHPRKTIIEFGAGNGEITKELINNQHPAEFYNYYAFELNAASCKKLEKEVPAAHIICANAFDFFKILPPGLSCDYFICSIPLSFYKKKQVQEFITGMVGMLNEKGKIVVLFHARWLISLLKSELPGSELKRFFSLPAYYLMIYQKNSGLQ